MPIINNQEVETESSAITENSINNVKGETRNTIIMQTAMLEEKILPTTKLYLEKYYMDCKHVVKTEVEMPIEMINLTKEDIVLNYPDWTVKEFSKEKVILYRTVEGLCNEHFVITDEKGVVVVYRLDEDYNKSLYEKTDIYTEYLPEQDVNRLKEGIYVYTVSDLNSELENME